MCSDVQTWTDDLLIATTFMSRSSLGLTVGQSIQRQLSLFKFWEWFTIQILNYYIDGNNFKHVLMLAYNVDRIESKQLESGFLNFSPGSKRTQFCTLHFTLVTLGVWPLVTLGVWPLVTLGVWPFTLVTLGVWPLVTLGVWPFTLVTLGVWPFTLVMLGLQEHERRLGVKLTSFCCWYGEVSDDNIVLGSHH